MAGRQRRHWMFTINNPTLTPTLISSTFEAIADFRYLVFQIEAGEEGTPHAQGYVEFSRAKRMTALKKVLSRAHWEYRRGTRAQARNYCMKEETRVSGPYETGEWVEQGAEHGNGGGARSDLAAFRDNIRLGKRKRDLIEDRPDIIAKYPKFYDTCKHIYKPQREGDLKVVLFYGEPGTGKTRFVVENYPDHYRVPCQNGNFWVDGYDGDNIVLIDDFCGKMSHVPLSFTLQLLDRYPVSLPVKGSFTWWLPNLICLTSNIHPRLWYNWYERESQYRALARRIHYVYHFVEDSYETDPTLIDVGLFFTEHWSY